MNDVPSWYDSILLGVAAWRVFHLLAYDDVAERIRRYVTRLGHHEDLTDAKGHPAPTPKEYRLRLAEFISCPYCLGFWIVLGWWVAWLIFPHATLLIAVPFALSAIVIGAHKHLSD